MPGRRLVQHREAAPERGMIVDNKPAAGCLEATARWLRGSLT